MGGGGGGGGGPPPRPEGFDDPWSPPGRFTFGERPESRDAYYETDEHGGGGLRWPRGGVDENGDFVEGEYSYNPVGEAYRRTFDFMKSGGFIPGGSFTFTPSDGEGSEGGEPVSFTGSDVWHNLFGQRPTAPTPRPELNPGGFPANHPAFTNLQSIGGIQGGFEPSSSGMGDYEGGFIRGETPAPVHWIPEYEKAGIAPPGYINKEDFPWEYKGSSQYSSPYKNYLLPNQKTLDRMVVYRQGDRAKDMFGGDFTDQFNRSRSVFDPDEDRYWNYWGEEDYEI